MKNLWLKIVGIFSGLMKEKNSHNIKINGNNNTINILPEKKEKIDRD